MKRNYDELLSKLLCKKKQKKPFHPSGAPLRHVAIDGSRMATSPWTHTMHCLRDVPACRNNGYGILKEGAGAGGAYELAYVFDTAGNTRALAFVDSDPAIDNVTVTVVGSDAGGGVLAVTSLVTTREAIASATTNPPAATTPTTPTPTTPTSPTTTVTHTGYLIDLFCWNKPGHLAIDGSRLASSPWTHTMHCLRDVPACRNNGYGVLKEVAGVGGASPTYDLAYTFDAAGNAKALALVDASAAVDNVTVGVGATS